MNEIPYIGNELDLFEKATVWKKYYGRFLAPYLRGSILEVGAGIGGTTAALCDGSQQKWLCLEPDPVLYKKLSEKIDQHLLPACCSAAKGTTADLPSSAKFNAIMYIDVIEHIENDRDELIKARSLLDEKGFLIVLVPAHQFLYNKFDKAIGHYRRYDKKMLNAVSPHELQLLKIRYFDACGYASSLVNKYLLKQDYPTAMQINFWDKFLVPISKFIDPVLNYSLGKTLVAIWQKK